MFEKIEGKDRKDIQTGLELFDRPTAVTITFSIMWALSARFRELKAEGNDLCRPVNYLTGIWGYGASCKFSDPEVEMTWALQKLNWSKSAILPAQPVQVLEKEVQEKEGEVET